MVASALMLLLLGMSVRLFWPGFRFVLEGGARAEVQQRTVLTLQKLVVDLQSTGACGLSLHHSDASETVVVQPIREVTPDPRVVYSTSLIGWLWRDGSLQRYLWSSPPGFLMLDSELPKRLEPSVLSALEGMTGQAQHTLSVPKVTLFEVRSAAPHDDIASPLTIRINVEGQHGSPPDSFTMERRVVLRNGF